MSGPAGEDDAADHGRIDRGHVQQILALADCAHVTVGGIWCVKEVGNHEGQEAGLKYGFDSIRSKWTFGSGSLRCQEFRRSFEKTG